MKLINDYKKTLKTLGFTLAKEQPKYYKRQETNPLQISTITDKKIHGVLENTGVVVSSRKKEHREKYFNGLKPHKFLKSLVVEDGHFNSRTFEMIVEKFIEDFTKGISLNVEMHKATEIPSLYSMQPNQLNDNGKRTYVTNCDTCMQGKPKSYFEVYANTKGLRLVTLEDKDGNMYGRALLWTALIDDKKKYYLDRIYISGTLSATDSIRSVYQAQLYKGVLKALALDNVSCYSISNFNINGLLTTKEAEAQAQPLNDFNPMLIDDAEALDFEHYPYADTFQGLDGQTYFTDYNNCEVALSTTEGENGNNERTECQECGLRMHEEDSCYSEHDDETFCHDCCTYSEYEEDYIHNDRIREHRNSGDLFHEDNV